MMRLRAQDVRADDAFTGDVLTNFRGYDLEALQIPMAARPRVNGNHMGRHGYTIRAPGGAAPCCNIMLKWLEKHVEN